MLATQVEVSNGTLNIINVGIEFFEQDDISVALGLSDPLLVGVDYLWINATTIQFQNTAHSPGGLVPAGVEVILRRHTKNDDMYNTYDGGAPFSRLTLDENFNQLLLLSQEFSEGLGLDGLRNDLDMNGYRITNLGNPQTATDAVNQGYVSDLVEDAVAGVVGGYGFFQQVGAGAVPRTFQDKMRDAVSVKDYGAVGDGVTDCTLQVAAAVQAAYTNSFNLHWPDGTYKVSNNILNLHDVKHTGRGRLLRGADLFRFDPLIETNIVYADPAGSLLNDGLTAAFPRPSLESACNILINYGPVLDGTWIVQLAAGTYSGTFTFPANLASRNPVVIRGPQQVHPANPTAIVDGGGAQPYGVNFLGNNLVTILDVWVRNFTTFGIVAQDFTTLNLVRVHATDVPGGPCIKMQQGRFYMTDGRAARGQIGCSFISGTTFTLASSAGTPGTGTIINNNTQAGVQAQEQSSGHVDNCYVDTNPIGFQCVQRSRVHALGTTITNSVTAAVRCYMGSDWFNNGCTLVANSTDELLYTGSIEAQQYQSNIASMRTPIDAAFITHTGTAAATVVKTYNNVWAANKFSNSTKTMRVRIVGTLGGVAGNKNILLKLGGTDVYGFTIPAAATGDFIIDGVMTSLGATQQTFSASAIVNGAVPQVSCGARGLAAITGAPLAATITVTLVSPADSVSIRTVEIFVS